MTLHQFSCLVVEIYTNSEFYKHIISQYTKNIYSKCGNYLHHLNIYSVEVEADKLPTCNFVNVNLNSQGLNNEFEFEFINL
jgi:hypothetical protein